VKARTHELEAEKTELLEAKAALAEQAIHDSLTGLMNRAGIIHVLEQQLRQSEREKTSFVVMLTDLDHFKNVNDTHGHLVGDDVLREFSRRLGQNLRPYDHAGRFGGEEFLIVMPGLSEDYGDRVRKLHQDLCHQSFVCGELELKVTCSIGVTFYRPTIKDIESLLREADLALYAAKENGRDRVELAGKLAGKNRF
jgi:diguanylate cyclase (GGDEF)-like protein